MPNLLADTLVRDIRDTTGGQPILVAFSGGLDSTVVAAPAQEGPRAGDRLLAPGEMRWGPRGQTGSMARGGDLVNAPTRAISAALGILGPKIVQLPGREGCKLKH